MNLGLEEANETQQMHNETDCAWDRDEEPKRDGPTAASPVTSTKLSSGAASFTSKAPAGHWLNSGATSSLHDSSKISFVNERRLQRENMRSNNKPRQIPKDGTDVKDMEKALLELLEDFQSGKLSAFSSGCSMEQMIHIRDQQEHLARLHFTLCADIEKPPDEDFENTAIQEKMSQLVHSLEQLSTSIEHIHSTSDGKTPSQNSEKPTEEKPSEP